MTTDHQTADSVESSETFVSKLAKDVGAMTTELAILVAVLVAIAVSLATIMGNSAESHEECIPETRGATPPADCER